MGDSDKPGEQCGGVAATGSKGSHRYHRQLPAPSNSLCVTHTPTAIPHHIQVLQFSSQDTRRVSTFPSDAVVGTTSEL